MVLAQILILLMLFMAFINVLSHMGHSALNCDNQHFSVTQVERAFHSTKINKSPGPDNICDRLLTTCATKLSPVFHKIVIKSLETKHVPRIWKDAVVVLVPKSSCPTTLNDLKPVALTSINIKILEKLVHLEILKKKQRIHGFYSLTSCLFFKQFIHTF